MDPTLREIADEQKTLRRLVEELASGLTHLAKVVEQNDYLEERAERAERQEQDSRHGVLIDKLDELRASIETLGAAHRGLPAAVLKAVEKEIYKLRSARWEASQNALAPARDQETTGRIKVPPLDEHTQPFAIHHRDGERRELNEIIGGTMVWAFKKSWRWILTSGISVGTGAALMRWLHR